MITKLHFKKGYWKIGLSIIILLLPQISSSQRIAYMDKSIIENNFQNKLIEPQNLKDVLIQLGVDQKVSIVYEETTVKGIKVKPGDKIDQNWETNLETILKPHGLMYQKTGKSTYVITRYEPKHSKNEGLKRDPVKKDGTLVNTQLEENVTGKVVDEKGGGLPGVSVVIKGTTRGTSTAIDGNFELDNVNENTTLVFSFVGYKSLEVIVGNKKILKFIFFLKITRWRK